MSDAYRSRLGEKINTLANLVRPWIAQVPGLHRSFRRLRARLPEAQGSPTAALMAAFGRAYPKAYFIQVGANDGAIYDPLRRQIVARHWHGIMIEPVPHIFAKLAKNYRDEPRVSLENIAIGAVDGQATFHSLAPVEDPIAAGLPRWYSGLGSFRLDVILSHRKHIPDIEQRVVTQTLPCLTFDSLCQKHQVQQLDLLQIDTEGYDYEVLKLVDFPRLHPRLIIYEHVHLSTDDRSAAESLVRGQGYELAHHRLDTLALRTAGLDRDHPGLLKAWRSHFPTAA
ncbi:MAG TPA: FkbM family methyltransferase [Candidatus Kapabacteria bacterium]|nr:FkbM family methyltransferase [Candidatus Kapabacteria bacterium]